MCQRAWRRNSVPVTPPGRPWDTGGELHHDDPGFDDAFPFPDLHEDDSDMEEIVTDDAMVDVLKSAGPTHNGAVAFVKSITGLRTRSLATSSKSMAEARLLRRPITIVDDFTAKVWMRSAFEH